MKSWSANSSPVFVPRVVYAMISDPSSRVGFEIMLDETSRNYCDSGSEGCALVFPPVLVSVWSEEFPPALSRFSTVSLRLVSLSRELSPSNGHYVVVSLWVLRHGFSIALVTFLAGKWGFALFQGSLSGTGLVIDDL